MTAARSDRLPTAHTCFNALMLSAGYKDKAALERALAVAIENSEVCGACCVHILHLQLQCVNWAESRSPMM